MGNKTILLISPEAWGNNFVSKHHYARYLSKKNVVYFLNPVSSSKINVFGNVGAVIEKIEDNLFLINYKNLIPRLNRLPKFIQSLIYAKQANQIKKALKIEQIDIVWSFDPFRFWNQNVWGSKKTIYHTVDVHFNKCFEQEISNSSDLVLISSELLRSSLQKSNSNIHYTGHSSDLDNFESGLISENKIPGSNEIKAGLVGNFNHNVDYDLIYNIATENSSIDFIFIGPYTSNNLMSVNDQKKEVEFLEKLDNVFFIGAVKSNEILGWLTNFDINLVLYREDKRDIIINPHKMMAYFYSGKITVCSWFNEYKDAEKELVYVSTNNVDLPNIIKEVSKDLKYWNKEDLQKFRRDFAIKNSYDNKIEDIIKLLEE